MCCILQEAEGVALAIPMPGHPVPHGEEASVLNDCKQLQNLILSHDVTFLLTDTRESRWLPTLFCASYNKVDSYTIFFVCVIYVIMVSLLGWRCLSSASFTQ